MLDRPFSDVCSTVSCWALLFSVILPSMQLMGLEVTAITPATASPATFKLTTVSSSSSSSSTSSSASISYAFTVYLESTSFQLQHPTLSISLLANTNIIANDHNYLAQVKQESGETEETEEQPGNHHSDENEVKADTARELQDEKDHLSSKRRRVVQVIRSGPYRSKGGHQHHLRTRTVWIEDADDQQGSFSDNLHKGAVAAVAPDPLIPVEVQVQQQQQRQGVFRSSRQRHPYANNEVIHLVRDHQALFDGDTDEKQSSTEQDDDDNYENPNRDDHASSSSLVDVNQRPTTKQQPHSDVASSNFIKDTTATVIRETRVRKQLWSGQASIVLRGSISNHAYNNGSESSKVQDLFLGPLVVIPFLATTLPNMPFQWIALVPCTHQNALDRELLSQLDAKAIVLYPTLEFDCTGLIEPLTEEWDTAVSALPAVLTMERESAKHLVSALDALATDTTTPMAQLSKIVAKPLKAPPLRPARIVFEPEDTLTTTAALTKESRVRKEQQQRNKGTRIGGTMEEEESTEEEAPSSSRRPSQPLPPPPSPQQRPVQEGATATRQVIISLPEIASIVDSFKAGAAIQARRVLVDWGLVSQKSYHRRTRVVKFQRVQTTKEYDPREASRPTPQPQPEQQPAVMVATAFRTLSNALFFKHEIRTFKDRFDDFSNDILDDTGYDIEEDAEMMETKARSSSHRSLGGEREGQVSSGQGASSKHLKGRTRPNRQMARLQANSLAQVLEDASSLVILKDSYQDYLHHHLHGSYFHHRQQHHSTDLLNSERGGGGGILTNISGKLAMVLMSTVCGVGVGMFGALLVVVALKVRLFRSRRALNGSNQNGGNGTTGQQQGAHQRSGHGQKKVLSPSTLDRFGIQTVVKTGDGTMLVASAASKASSKCCDHHCHRSHRHHSSQGKKKKVVKLATASSIPEMSQVPRRSELRYSGRLANREDVINMDAGVENQEANRQDASRHRQQRQVGVTNPQISSSRGAEEAEISEETMGERVEDDAGHHAHSSNALGLQEFMEEEETEQQLVDTTTATTTTAEFERISSSLMATARHGSYRRVSYSRQGYRNSDWINFNESSSSSLSSSTLTLHSSSSLASGGSSSTLVDSSYSEASSSSLSLSISHSLSTSQRADKLQGCVADDQDSGIDSDEEDSKMEEESESDSDDDECLPFTNANAQTMCAVCLAEYELGDQVRTLPCFHQFHQACIDPWLLQVVALCPICKRDLLMAPATSSCS